MKKIIRYTDGNFDYTFEPLNDEATIIEKADGFSAFYLVKEEYPESPDKWQDDGLFLVNYHRDFWVENKLIDKTDTIEWYQGHKIVQEDDFYIFGLTSLVHSGVWLSLNAGFNSDPGGWDTSHVGLVLASKKEFPTREDALKQAGILVEIWNQYLSGDVYGVVEETYDKNKNQIDQDSCWGFYGHESAKEELQTMINSCEKEAA